MNRVDELEMRRRTLLMRCAAQREELAIRLRELRVLPQRWLEGTAAPRTRGDSRLGGALGWVSRAAATIALGRPREILTTIMWVRSALSLASRLTQIVGLVGAFRSLRSGARSRRVR